MVFKLLDKKRKLVQNQAQFFGKLKIFVLTSRTIATNQNIPQQSRVVFRQLMFEMKETR